MAAPRLSNRSLTPHRLMQPWQKTADIHKVEIPGQDNCRVIIKPTDSAPFVLAVVEQKASETKKVTVKETLILPELSESKSAISVSITHARFVGNQHLAIMLNNTYGMRIYKLNPDNSFNLVAEKKDASCNIASEQFPDPNYLIVDIGKTQKILFSPEPITMTIRETRLDTYNGVEHCCRLIYSGQIAAVSRNDEGLQLKFYDIENPDAPITMDLQKLINRLLPKTEYLSLNMQLTGTHVRVYTKLPGSADLYHMDIPIPEIPRFTKAAQHVKTTFMDAYDNIPAEIAHLVLGFFAAKPERESTHARPNTTLAVKKVEAYRKKLSESPKLPEIINIGLEELQKELRQDTYETLSQIIERYRTKAKVVALINPKVELMLSNLEEELFQPICEMDIHAPVKLRK